MPRLRATPTVEPQRMRELTQLLKSAFKAERLLDLWKLSPDRTTFVARAKETDTAYTEEIINHFLKP